MRGGHSDVVQSDRPFTIQLSVEHLLSRYLYVLWTNVQYS
jgi:hypothetical protein